MKKKTLKSVNINTNSLKPTHISEGGDWKDTEGAALTDKEVSRDWLTGS